MLSDFQDNSIFTAIFEGKCPDTKLLIQFLRWKCSSPDINVDLFSGGGKTLMIAYPAPPKAVGVAPVHSRRTHRHF